jgi:hypothetical protein
MRLYSGAFHQSFNGASVLLSQTIDQERSPNHGGQKQN